MKRETRELAIAAALAVAVAASGLLVVGTKHRGRQLFMALEELNAERDRLQVDWKQLQIEQSMLATHPRIETLAREELDLAPPSEQQTRLVVEERR